MIRGLSGPPRAPTKIGPFCGSGCGHIAALEPERLGDAQARSIQQRHHCGVARPDPGIAGFAGALVGVGETLGCRHLDRLRQALADLGGRGPPPAPRPSPSLRLKETPKTTAPPPAPASASPRRYRRRAASP